MADEKPPEDTPPSWFETYQKNMVEKMDAGLTAVAQRQDQLAQYVAEQGQLREKPQPQAYSKEQTDQAGQKLLSEMLENPIQFYSKLTGLNKAAAAQVAEEKIKEFQETQRKQDDYQGFWDGFYAHHQDLSAFHAQVEAAFHSQPQALEPSKRADAAAEQVRSLLAQQRADAVEGEKRAKSQRRMTASATSGALDATPGLEDDLDPKQAARDAVREMEEYRTKRTIYNHT